MKTVKAVTKDSFNISGRGMLVELKHSLRGLEKGVILISESSKMEWRMVVRILF